MKESLPDNTVEYVVSGIKVIQEPVVSVVMITYNHEHFIEEAVEGVMMQECDFPIELIISEDCSTDNTRARCIELKEKYPDKIRLLLSERNKGMSQNILETLASVQGQFFALCDGDDRWIDPDKMRIQVDFLMSNKGAGGCYHNCTVIDEKGNVIKSAEKRSGAKNLSFGDIIRGKRPAPTSSFMFRYVPKEMWPDWFIKPPVLDAKIALLASMLGPIVYLDFTGVAYRLHRQGFWSGKKEIEQLQFRIQHMNSLLSSRDAMIRKAPIYMRKLSYVRRKCFLALKTHFSQTNARGSNPSIRPSV